MYIILMVCLAWLTVSAEAQFNSSQSRVSSIYPDISIEAATHLRTAASYASDKNWPEAIELYQKLIDRFGDKTVQVESLPLYVTVRDYCHMRLIALPPEAIQLYRTRMDSLAESWFRAGLRNRDRSQLQRVVDQAFASSWGDDALDALAEMAFESGQFDEALLLWRRIRTGGELNDSELDEARSFRGLLYPDTDLDQPMLESKRILCQLFLRRMESAGQAIVEFRRSFPRAKGSLAGAEGVLADRLDQIAREIAGTPTVPDTDWTTFGGNAQRSKVMPQAVDIGSVQWTVPLPQTVQPRLNYGNRPTPANNDDLLSFHPLVVRDMVLINGREEVMAFDLREGPKSGGGPLWPPFRLRDQLGQGSVVTIRPAFGAPHYTMTADRDRLFVRLGAPETTLPARRGGQPDSYLVCLDLRAEGKELWPRVQPDELDMAFEGSPAVGDGNVFIGVTRGGAMTHSYLACYDAASGVRKWRTLICESSSTSGFFNQGSITHNLPTLGAGMVFYNTNLGAVAALDQRSGQIRWIAGYTREGRDDPVRPGSNSPGRELSPCIYYDGLVLAMPADGQGIYAFDAQSGKLRWRVPEPPHLVHLLGVAHGNLICTGSQVVAIDVTTGRNVWQWSDSASTTPYGRGTLAGDYVYFPTRTNIYVLDQRSGVLAKPKIALQDSHNQSPGNLVVGDGYLIVAQAKSLTVFCQYDVLIRRYQDRIAENPRDPEPHLRLARTAEAGGSIPMAVEHYRLAIEFAAVGGTDEDRSLRQNARSQLYALLLRLGQDAVEGGNWGDAEEKYSEASLVATTMQGRLEALLSLAESWRRARDASKSLAVYQRILEEESLRGLGIRVDASRTVRADVEVAGRIQSLLVEHGLDIYSPYEASAREILEEARRQASVAAAERLLQTHPNAQLVTETLLFLATEYSEAGHFAAASTAYKQLLARPGTPRPMQALAVQGIAELHEAQRAWQSARVWWQRLADEFPDTPIPRASEQSVVSFVADRLAQAPYAEMQGQPEQLKLPLARKWNRLWNQNCHVLLPEGNPPAELGLLLLATDQASVECVAVASGTPLWEYKAGAPVRWAAFHEDRLLMGTDLQLVCVNAASGELVWQQRTSSGLPGFNEFRLVDDRVFLREQSRRLVCLSAAAGNVIWDFTPTEGTIQPRAYFSSQHVAFRTKEPGKLIVLDGDGRSRIETAIPGEPWDYDPVVVDAHRICVNPDARSIHLIDLRDGKVVWSFAGPNSDQKPLPIAGPSCLLVLLGGTTVMKLDPASGKPLWSARISDDVLPRHGKTWLVDSQFFYCVTRELNLRAFSLEDGELAWERHLTGPGDQWQLAAEAGLLLATPRRPSTIEGLPLVICRQSDGRLVQRLHFRPQGSEAIVHVGLQQALIGSEREVWALAKP